MQCTNDSVKTSAANDRRPSFFGLVGIFALVLFVGLVFSALGLSGLGSAVTGSISLASAVLIGLVASVSSCTAVAGGLLVGTVAKYNERLGEKASGSKRSVPAILFVAGRMVSYIVFGGLIAVAGNALNPSPMVYGLIILAAALAMLLLGLDMLGLLPHPFKRLMPRMPLWLGRRIMAAGSSSHPLAPFLLGAATFFLPCGFTQALQIYALSLGSFAAGAAVLGAFALGTAPALLVLGWASGSFRGGFKRFFFMFAGAAIVLLGLSNIVNGLSVMGVDFSIRRDSGTASVSSNVEVISGVQVVKMKVRSDGYEPANVTIRANMPTRWELDASNAVGCVRSLVSRPLGLSQVLSVGPNVIEFVSPASPGSYPFSCSMGMYRGSFNVIE